MKELISLIVLKIFESAFNKVVDAIKEQKDLKKLVDQNNKNAEILKEAKSDDEKKAAISKLASDF